MSRLPGKARGFGKAVQTARLERGWSQSHLATEAGVSRPTVSRIELGNDPSMRTARKLTAALGLTLEIAVAEEKG